MSVAHSAPFTGTVPRSQSGTHVDNVRRISIDDVRDAYRDHAMVPLFAGYHVVLIGNRVKAATPLYALAVAGGFASPDAFRRMSLSADDPCGAVALGMMLGLEPDYVRGLHAGWAGYRPEDLNSTERIGWRDGSACWAALAA
jgi:hypothetical protein